ncbi:hypothetical protein CGLO_01920 [Colletotrichum gloeosporioides Cg-14]|uniref:Uncharacterized protein n=1 Tax=Colletotrichum gloeosporioides (strain Cg-14) TaxID=1237896 RepID=T0KPW2_COLGC|nr:hypothetical protein CGLO_01920 [Colletotrichum gloeosporioides Cg-14]
MFLLYHNHQTHKNSRNSL